MLTQLLIKNFALIDSLTIDFAPGFNVLTGETGAGKSILIDAFGAVVGGRLSVEQIRQGTDACLVQAVFDLRDEAALRQEIEQVTGSIIEDGQLMLLRRYGRTGRGQAFVNGVQVPVSVLRQVGETLVEIHGQHESQRLLKPGSYLEILDAYAGAELALALTNYRRQYQAWQLVKRQLQQAVADEAERERKLDMLRWQTKELGEANLSLAEETALQQESIRLGNWEKIAVAVRQAGELLDSEERGGILAALHELQQLAARIGKLEQSFADFVAPLKDAAYLLAEIKDACARYENEMEFDPERVAQVGERLDLYYRLKRKYGPTTEEALAFFTRAQTELRQLDTLSGDIETWREQERQLHAELASLARTVTELRQDASGRFGTEVTKELRALAMGAAVFVAEVVPETVLGPNGQDKVAFLFSANTGMAPKELAKVASGGELSRIALAFKRILVALQSLPVTVFDEIDSGVGGLTALRMAEQIAAVAAGRQVLCVTHLPQIASMADHHLVNEKLVVDGQTVTTVRQVEGEARVQEMVRLIAGEQHSAAAMAAAREMLREAQAKKGR